MASEGTQLGKAYVQIIPSARGISGRLSGELGGELKNAGVSSGKYFGSSLITAATGVISAAGIGKVLSQAISQGSELQQNLGGVSAVFGDFAADITASAQNAYSQMGLSASDYMATANKMGSLFQGSGLEQQRAMELSSQAMQRAADVASVMGIDMSMAMESIAGAAKGNFTMMDNLGVAMNATTLQAYALEKGVNFKWNTASNAEKAELAMQMFFDRTEQYAGNFERESKETFSGAFGAMKAAASNVLGKLALGENIKPELQALSGTVVTFLTGNLLPMVGNVLRALPGAVGTFVQSALPELTTYFMQFFPMLKEGITTKLPEILQMAVSTVSTFVSGLGQQLPQLAHEGTAWLKVLADNIEASLPVMADAALQAIVSFINGLVQSSPTIISSAFDIIGNLASGLIASMPSIYAAACDVIVNFVGTMLQPENLLAVAGAGWDLLMSVVQGAVDAYPEMTTAFWDMLGELKNIFSEIDWPQLGKDVISGVVRGITSMGSVLWEGLKSTLSAAVEGAKDFLGIASPSKVMRDQVGRWIPAGMAEGIKKYTSGVTSAMRTLADQTTGTLQTRLTAQMHLTAGAPVAAAAGSKTYFYQTINSHDSLSPYEMTQEAENFIERSRWKNP